MKQVELTQAEIVLLRMILDIAIDSFDADEEVRDMARGIAKKFSVINDRHIEIAKKSLPKTWN